MKGSISVALTLLLSVLILFGAPCVAQKKGGGGGGNTEPSTGDDQTPQQSNGTSPAPISAGITNGTMPIESTLLVYKALAGDAEKIAAAVAGSGQNHVVIVATPSDLASIVQWRTTMYQARLLDQRVKAATAAIPTEPPDSLKSVPQTKTAAVGGILSSVSDINTLIQTVASVFAVKESLTVASGPLTPSPLTNLVADKLRAKATDIVYVPGIYTPDLLSGDDIDSTYIGARLKTLEDDRQAAVTALQGLSGIRSAAETVRTGPGANPNVPSSSTRPANPSTPPFSQQQKSDAVNFENSYASKAAVLNSAIANIDNFESTLLTGQSASSGNQRNGSSNANPAPNSTANNNVNNGVAAGANAPPPGGPAPSPKPRVNGAGGPTQSPNPSANGPVTPNQPPTNQTNPDKAAGTQPASPSATETPIEQILPADLLAHRIWGGKEPSQDQVNNLQILVIQPLESGGNDVSKSNLFAGTKYYFSGGAVVAFGLYGIDGDIKCGGFAYAYGGNAKEEDFSSKLGNVSIASYVESNCSQGK
jgi:hypothetical protein